MKASKLVIKRSQESYDMVAMFQLPIVEMTESEIKLKNTMLVGKMVRSLGLDYFVA